jgi:uncharacterized protein YbcC (UPF0753/DUF2309 family)
MKRLEIDNFLLNVAKHLPIIRPIKEFVHLNLLANFQHLNFWDALREVSSDLDARPFLDLNYYQDLLNKNEIDQRILKQIMQKEFGNQSEADRIYKRYHNNPLMFEHHDARVGRFHFAWNELTQAPITELADGLLIKWLGMFLDQGVCQWKMPEADKLDFYQAIRNLLTQTLIQPTPFNGQDLEILMPLSPFDAIENHLAFLCPPTDLRQDYLKEAMLGLRGWAGLIASLQKDATLLDHPRKITLHDFLAVKLTLERAWILHYKPNSKSPQFFPFSSHTPHPYLEEECFKYYKCLQKAHEVTIHDKKLCEIILKTKSPSPVPRFQAIFCMDDREGFLRQNLESASQEITTFGTAGHFGIECLYQAPDAFFPRKHCPLPVAAKLLIKEKNTEMRSTPFSLKNALALFKGLFFPVHFDPLDIVMINRDAAAIPLDNTPTKENLPNGYQLSEMSLLAYSQLKAIGLLKNFAPLVFAIGHTSQSANNPYFNAYGCGACSGRSGEINARIFCQIINRADVRADLLARYQVDIPATTTFVPGVHDTCRESVVLFTDGSLNDEKEDLLKEFTENLKSALKRNALRRIVPLAPDTPAENADHALKLLKRRSDSLFEPRPELGHTNVAFSIVGRRELTRGIDLEGLAFLQSYDHTVDPDGVILQNILSAVIPVTSGIGLDYFFSRTDNFRFGAGSKLPQNVVGLFGVSHGTESDLLVGLPLQMIDQHHPVRLLILVEQSADIAYKAIKAHPQVNQIVSNEWVRYMSLDPHTAELSIFHDGAMHTYNVAGGIRA